MQTKHYKSYKFDVCNTTDCQVYQGANLASDLTDQAAEETAGIAAFYDGEYAELYYYSSNGGASENSENVWTKALPYLTGKYDPYEDAASIPGYSYTVSYTYDQLTKMLQNKGYSIGQISSVYISETTDVGNVREITFTDTSGKTLKVTGETCRTIFYTTLFGDTKSVKSMRFTINGGGGSSGYYLGSGSASVQDPGGALHHQRNRRNGADCRGGPVRSLCRRNGASFRSRERRVLQRRRHHHHRYRLRPQCGYEPVRRQSHGGGRL